MINYGMCKSDAFLDYGNPHESVKIPEKEGFIFDCQE